MRALVVVLLALAAVLPIAATADVRTPGFQIEADGLMFNPVGTLASQQDVQMSSLFADGGGWSATATIGLSRHWAAGLRVSSFESTKNGSFAFAEIGAPAGQPYADGAGPFPNEHHLKLLPIHAILQYRRPLPANLELLADGGFGVMSTTDHVALFSNRGNGVLSSLSGYQKDASWTLGLGLAVPVPANLDLVGSARYCGTLTGDGAAWVKDDNPAFTNWALGLRYPHNTH